MLEETKIGRFDNAESLLKAYNALNKEFTKKSQRLKESEREIELLKSQINDESLHLEYAKKALSDDSFVSENIIGDENIRVKIIEDYLTSLVGLNAPKTLNSSAGSTVLSPPSRPRSLKEAKKLAEIILNN